MVSGGDTTAYIYSENDNISFRYKDYSGNVQYTNVSNLQYHNHDTTYVKLDGSNRVSNRIYVESSHVIDDNIFDNAHIVVKETNVNGGGRASIGFHNGGNVGAAIYLNNNGRFRTKYNGGNDFAIYDTSCLTMSLSGTTLTINNSV